MVVLLKCAALTLLIILSSTGRLLSQGDAFADVDFGKADSVAALYPDYSLRDLRKLADRLTTPLSSDAEKFRAIYSWICSNVESDYQYYVTNKTKREKLHNNPEALKKWNKKFSTLVFKKLLNEKKTVCSGYAYLLKELAYSAGLSCVIIDGYGRTAEANIGGPGIANHSWNAIQLNGQWYLCDATWSSGSIDTQNGTFVKRFDEAYFLADPSLFIRNHYPLDSSWILMPDKPTLPEFLKRPLVYSSIYQYKITEIFPASFDISVTKGQKVSFRFKAAREKILQKVELQINGSRISPQFSQEPDGYFVIDHIFTSNGKFVVHILLNSSYAFTHDVKVKSGERRMSK